MLFIKYSSKNLLFNKFFPEFAIGPAHGLHSVNSKHTIKRHFVLCRLLRVKSPPLNKILGSQTEIQLWALVRWCLKAFGVVISPSKQEIKAALDETATKSQ